MTPRIRRLALAAAVVAAPVALRAQTSVLPTFEACYVPASGTVYRINTAASPAPGAPSACLTPTHVRFTWNQQGPAGPQGPQGPQGAAGARGAQGPAATLSYQRVTQPATLSANSYSAVAANCPPGRKVVGGGFDLASGPTGNEIVRVLIHESYPATDAAWRLGISNANGRALTGTAYAVCL